MAPLILLDVDGVLNPHLRPGREWDTHLVEGPDQSYKVILNADHGPALLTLAEQTGAELVWATTWEEMANRSIGPLIGLPELPVIPVSSGDGPVSSPWINSKTAAVAEYVKGRPFVWFDDDLSRDDTTWLKAHDGVGAFRIIHVGGRHGLTDRHITQAGTWLRALEAR